MSINKTRKILFAADLHGNIAKYRRVFEAHGFEFIGMNRVADYPFRLKDRCRRDGPGYVFQ